jgi:hypothetical protein
MCETYATFRSEHATYVWNRRNLLNKPLKHFQHVSEILVTYATSPIYFCNIHMKQLQYTSETSETLETYACNMRFHHNISLLRPRIAAPMASTAARTFLARNDGIGSTPVTPRRARGTRHSAQQRGRGAQRAGASGDGGGTTLDGGAARREMGCMAGKMATTSVQHSNT